MLLYFAKDKESLSKKNSGKLYPNVPTDYSILDEWKKRPDYLQATCGGKGQNGDRQILVIDWDNKQSEDPYEYCSLLNYRLTDLGISGAYIGSLIHTTNAHVQSYIKIDRVWCNSSEYAYYMPAVHFLNDDGFGDIGFTGQNAKNLFTNDPDFKFIKNPYYDGSSINVVDFCKENGLTPNSYKNASKPVKVKTVKFAGQKVEYADDLKTDWSIDRIQDYWHHAINIVITDHAAELMQRSRCYFFLDLGFYLYRCSRENYVKWNSPEELLDKVITLINECGMYDLSDCRYEYMLRQIVNAFAYAETGYKCGEYSHSGQSHEFMSEEEFSQMTKGRIWWNKCFILQAMIDVRNGKTPVWTYGKGKGKEVSQKTIEKWQAEYDIEKLKDELVIRYRDLAEKQMKYDGSRFQDVYTTRIDAMPYAVKYEFEKNNRIDVLLKNDASAPSNAIPTEEQPNPPQNIVKGQTLREYRLRELRGNMEENTRNVVEKPPEGGGMSREEMLEDWKNFLRAERSMAG